MYADHNVARGVAANLGRLGHAVTMDEEDFKLLHDAWRRWSTAWGVAPQHAGVVIPPQEWAHRRIAEAVDALLRSGAPIANEL